MEEQQPQLQTELTRNPMPGELVPVDKRHQFDGAKFNYQRTSSRLVLWVAVIILGFGALAAFFLFTNEGKNLLKGVTGSSSSSVASSLSSSVEASSSSSTQSLPPERDFSSLDADAAVDLFTGDYTDIPLQETDDFADFDTELEFGL